MDSPSEFQKQYPLSSRKFWKKFVMKVFCQFSVLENEKCSTSNNCNEKEYPNNDTDDAGQTHALRKQRRNENNGHDEQKETDWLVEEFNH